EGRAACAATAAPPCRAGGTMRGRIAGQCSAGHQRLCDRNVSHRARRRLRACCLRPGGLPASFILLIILVYLGSPDPWSVAGRLRDLDIPPSERCIPAPEG